MKNNIDRMKVLVAGAGGVLGRELVDVLYQRGIEVVGLGYRECEFEGIEEKVSNALCCDVTKPEDLKGVCDGIDIVISVIGITRIKPNLTHMDVDYRGNLNLLNAAREGRVEKFVFISPAGVDKGRDYVPLFKAKHLFEEDLKASGMNWLIFRSGGFFKDLAEMGEMAERGSMFVIGGGGRRFTPIDVRELAEIMVEDSLRLSNRLIEVGGPEDMSWRDICSCCFAARNKQPRIISIPAWLCRLTLPVVRFFSHHHFALGRLILYTSTTDLPTSKRGRRRFSEYLKAIHKNSSF